MKSIIKPKKLKPGDTIGVLAPAGAINPDTDLDLIKYYFEKKGYKVKFSKSIKEQKNYLAGDDEKRAADLMSFFMDEEVSAILSVRGGYGSVRLIKHLDFNVIKQHPKIFVGYSDITFLLNAINKLTGLVCFHGPMAIPDFGIKDICEYTETSFFEILEGKAELPFKYKNTEETFCIKSGECEGELSGGNLAIVQTLIGAEYMPDLNGKILLLEDINEPLYKLDRMLMHLKITGVFDDIAGLLFAGCTGVEKKDELVALIDEITNEYNFPIAYGFPAGHDRSKATLPLGIRYKFNATDASLILRDKYLEK